MSQPKRRRLQFGRFLRSSGHPSRLQIANQLGITDWTTRPQTQVSPIALGGEDRIEFRHFAGGTQRPTPENIRERASKFGHGRLEVLSLPRRSRGSPLRFVLFCPVVYGDCLYQHRMFAEQVTAEYFIKTEGRGRTVDEWKARPEQPDNHWLDCLVGCAVGASMQDALLFGTDAERTPKTKRISFKEMQRRRRD